MTRAATLLVQGEQGVFTIFSLPHFLWGAVFHLLWVVLGVGDAWVSGLLISTLAIVFEICENSEFVGTKIWERTWGYRTGERYTPDTLTNSQSDTLFSNLGFFVVQLTEVLADGAAAARVGLAIACGAIALVFLVVFFARQTALEATTVATSEPASAPATMTTERRWFLLKL